jgi:integrase
MATVAWVVLKHLKKADGTYNPKIRISHNGTSSYIATPIFTEFVKFKRGAASGTVTSGKLIDSLNDTVKMYREIINETQDLVSSCEDSKSVVSLLERRMNRNSNIDFIKYARKYISTIENKNSKIIKNTGLNALEAFMNGETLYVKNLTSNLLRKFEAWLRSERTMKINGKDKILNPLSDSGINVAMGSIRSIFNHAIEEFNDYELGDIVITNNPFKSYKIPKVCLPEKRAVDAAVIKKVFNYTANPGRTFRLAEMARDIYMLSFCLAGMNAVDLYNSRDLNEGRIEYKRTKTKHNRRDEAFISVGIIPEIQKLVEKYRDVTNNHVFDFYKRYSSAKAFNTAIYKGMKTMCEELEIDYIQFYSARHSFATIARNDCNISKDDIGMCLNHSTTASITDVYIKKDFTRIDEVIKIVVDFVLNKES